MNLSADEANLVFAVMRDLSGDFAHTEVRQRVGHRLLELLDADYFASYVWDKDSNIFVSGVHLNMSPDNLANYETYYQFHDPITPTLQRRRKATLVSSVMPHNRLAKTEFYNDFLRQDGLCYGINYFAYDRGMNIGDIRIWRGNVKDDFTERDSKIVDAIGPSFVNALIRAKKYDKPSPSLRFSSMREKFHFTKREAEIADILVLGASDEQICQQLFISKSTLRSHISAIFRKSGFNRRAQLSQLLT